jgi:hypothetical protein
MASPSRGLFPACDQPDLDVTECDPAMITLQRDVAGIGLRESRHPREFALGDPAIEVLTAQDILEILDAIDLMLALLRGDEQTHMIPLTDGFGGVERFAGIGIGRRLV